MKTKTTVWALSWDTENGNDCSVFGSEEELTETFAGIICSSIVGLSTPDADGIRKAVSEGDVALAYALWQDTYKPELDTYNWGPQEVMVDVELEPKKKAK